MGITKNKVLRIAQSLPINIDDQSDQTSDNTANKMTEISMHPTPLYAALFYFLFIIAQLSSVSENILVGKHTGRKY